MDQPLPLTRRLAAAPGSGSAGTWRRAALRAGRDLVAAALAAACFYPFHLAIDASLRALAVLGGHAGWPLMPSPSEWTALLQDVVAGGASVPRLRTLAVAAGVVLVALFLGATARYAFGGASPRGHRRILPLLGATLLPQVALLSCLFELPAMQHVYNHWWGLAMPYLTFTLPFAVWGALVFADRAPARRHPASGRDGCALWPSLASALLATGLLAFIAAWGEFMHSATAVLDSTQLSRPVLAPAVPGLFAGPAGPTLASGLAAAGLAALATALVPRLLRSIRRRRAARRG